MEAVDDILLDDGIPETFARFESMSPVEDVKAKVTIDSKNDIIQDGKYDPLTHGPFSTSTPMWPFNESSSHKSLYNAVQSKHPNVIQKFLTSSSDPVSSQSNKRGYFNSQHLVESKKAGEALAGHTDFSKEEDDIFISPSPNIISKRVDYATTSSDDESTSKRTEHKRKVKRRTSSNLFTPKKREDIRKREESKRQESKRQDGVLLTPSTEEEDNMKTKFDFEANKACSNQHQSNAPKLDKNLSLKSNKSNSCSSSQTISNKSSFSASPDTPFSMSQAHNDISNSSLDNTANNSRLNSKELLHRTLESSNSVSSQDGDETPVPGQIKRLRKVTAVDGLLFDIYDRYHKREPSLSVDSDITECSTTSVSSVYVASSFENDDRPKLDRNYLQSKGKNDFIQKHQHY